MMKKIAFIGSVGAGKTTIVKRLSNIETINTDVLSSIDIGKNTTTVGIDYGRLEVDEDLTLGLYGVPGQRKFSIMWDAVKEGLWATVILVKNNDFDSIKEMEYLINYFGLSKETPVVIGVTHTDVADVQNTFDRIRSVLTKHNFSAPIFSIDPRTRSSAMLIMDTIVALEETA